MNALPARNREFQRVLEILLLIISALGLKFAMPRLPGIFRALATRRQPSRQQNPIPPAENE